MPRRPRAIATSTRKPIALGERDFEIFRALRRYRYLRSTYLHAFAGGASTTRFKERLGNLFHEGFLDRPNRQWEFAGACNRPAIHEWTAKACRFLNESDGAVSDQRTFLSAGTQRQFKHAVLVCECLASFELACRNNPDRRFIAWPEILARAPEATRALSQPFRLGSAVVPDGLFGLEYCQANKSSYRFFALEVDCATMPVTRNDISQSSIQRKLDGYEVLIERSFHRDVLGIPNLFVLFACVTRARRDSMLSNLSRPSSCDAVFLFQHLDEPGERAGHPQVEALTRRWERRNCSPLAIDAGV